MTSKGWWAQARRLFPGGVNSPVRSFSAVGGTPIFFKSGRGPYLTDVEGKRYVDMVGSWGPMIMGHAHPKVVEAIHRAASRGTSFGACHPLEVKLGSMIRQALPSMERMRLVSSGTEATMSALRLARAATGRKKILKFSGCYHGHVDSLLVKAGSGVATLGLSSSAGVPQAWARDTLVVPYNNLEACRTAFRRHGKEIAAVIVEPIAANMGVILPEGGFWGGLRRLTRRYGALLIFDEVITGFRLGFGGAQALYKIRPDLTCLGKIIGGGLPVGAYGGSAKLMKHIAPEGGVYQAGTLSGNPVAMAAGVATLELLKEKGVYRRLEQRSLFLAEGLEKECRQVGVKARIQRAGSLLTVFFGVQTPIHNYEEAAQADTKMFRKYFHGMLKEGVYLPPSQFEAWFLSTTHSETVLNKVLSAHRHALSLI